MEVECLQGVEHEKELIQREFNQMELGKFVQLLLKVQRTLLTNSSILLVDVLLTEKLNQQEVLEKATVLGTIIIPLDFGLNYLIRKGVRNPNSPIMNQVATCPRM